jgi:hypothetical protein
LTSDGTQSDSPSSGRPGGVEQFDDPGTDVVVILMVVVFVIAIPLFRARSQLPGRRMKLD